MNIKRHHAPIALLLALLLITAGCTSGQVITDLELAVDAVAVALPLIGPAAGLPAALQSQIQGYLTATATAIGQASDILAGPGDNATKAAEIAAAFAGIAVPAVPAKYQGIAQAVQQVALLVAKFLATLPVPSTQPVAMRAPGAVVSAPGTATKWSNGDRARLVAIKAKALTLAHK